MAVRIRQARIGGRRAFLIAHRPHEDAGMVAVAPHQVLELREALGVRRHHAGFVEHQHAQFIGGVQQLRRGRIVRGAQGVAAHLLELAHAEVLHRVGQRRAHARVVLVIAGPLQLDGLAVEEEALLGVERAGADAEGRLVAVRDGAARLDLGHQLVQVALFERPQRGRLHHHLLLVGVLAPLGEWTPAGWPPSPPPCPRDREWSR